MRNNRGFIGGLFIMLSIIGVLLGIALVWLGWKGIELSAPVVLGLGLFVTVKEILDIFH